MKLGDTALLAKLAPGDMIALEAKYDYKCLVQLYNRARAVDRTCADKDIDARLHGIAFAELVAYIEDFHMEESVAPVFKLADLANMYKAHLEQLGADVEGHVHITRLKVRLLSVFPDLRAQLQGPGRGVLLTFDDSIGGALKKAREHDHDNDAMHLA